MRTLPKGQYIRHVQHGLGVATQSDAERTSIDYQLHGPKKLATKLVVVEPTNEAPPPKPRLVKARGTSIQLPPVTRVEGDWTPSQAPDPPKKSLPVGIPLGGYTIWGYWELKRISWLRKETVMSEEGRGVVASVKDRIVATVKGVGKITDAVVDTVSGSLVNAIKHTGDVGVAISDVVRGVILGVAEIGADVGKAAKGAVIGVLRSTKEVGGEAVDAVSKTAGAVVKNTAELGGDLGSAAKGAVEGAITGAKDLGLSAEEAASAAATGALKAAGEIGSEAAAQVRDAVTGTIAGVKVVVKEPFRKAV
jgi:hypothetical protein